MIPSSVAPNTVRGALYYPFPYIQDENWLKEQALFWDHLYRIVPTGFRDMEFKGQLVHPTATESAFRDELDFVKDCGSVWLLHSGAALLPRGFEPAILHS
jgi:hypothetical protein